MKFLFFILLVSSLGCQQQGKTDLVFSDLANQPQGGSTSGVGLGVGSIPDELQIPEGLSAEVSLPINTLLTDRYYILSKFMDLFGIEANQLGPDHPQVTLYDKIKPAIYQFGHFGGGCDYYASVNAWPPQIKDTGSTVVASFQTYKLLPGIQQQFWHESCWNFHLPVVTWQGLTRIDWVEPVISSPARWAVNTRICHFLTKNDTALGSFLTRKMGFTLTALPEFDTENLAKLMTSFHPAYQPKDNELTALLAVRTLFPETLTNANKLEMWRTAIQAVCQSPFWHSP